MESFKKNSNEKYIENIYKKEKHKDIKRPIISNNKNTRKSKSTLNENSQIREKKIFLEIILFLEIL